MFEVPIATTKQSDTDFDLEHCGVNCNWGFGVGIVIAMVGPLPGPT